MKNIVLSVLTLCFSTCILMSCSSNKATIEEDIFYKGADISWVTEMESKGHKFYNAKGEERECTALMKEYGMNAVRLRVWVNPEKHNNWCNKEDMLVKALRAKELDMEVMVNFHYSDWWADPAKQNIPEAWSGHTYEEMKQDVANHTREVLQFLKDNGITPKWVQVGNETSNGFLWSVKKNERGWEIKDEEGRTTITESMGHAQNNPEQYAGLFAAGYDAVKEIFPEAIAMVHLDNGFDENLYNWNLDILKNNGAKFDMIGMSLYPFWAMDTGHRSDAETTITDCIANIKKVSEKYGCDVMIVETGMEALKPEEGYAQLSRIIRECKENTNGRCKGVFYWEPECKPSQYKLGAFTEDGRPTKIMDAFKE